MSRELEALEKIDHTICLAYQENNNALFNKDKYDHCDCNNIEDFIGCYDVVEKAIKEHEQYKAIEEKLGIDLLTFLKGVNPNTCFMQITKDKKFDFCGDAYYGYYTKEELLKLIQNLLYMYWGLTKGD